MLALSLGRAVFRSELALGSSVGMRPVDQTQKHQTCGDTSSSESSLLVGAGRRPLSMAILDLESTDSSVSGRQSAGGEIQQLQDFAKNVRAEQQDAGSGSVLVLGSGLDGKARVSAESQAQVWDAQDCDAENGTDRNPRIGVYVQHCRQRSYVATCLTWIYYALSRLLFGIRKAPHYPAAIYFSSAQQLAELVDQLYPETKETTTQDWVSERLARNSSWMPRRLTTLVDGVPSLQTILTQSSLDRMLHAAAAMGWDVSQVEAESEVVSPRQRKWLIFGSQIAGSFAGMAALGKDWWNWRLFDNQNAAALTSHRNDLADDPAVAPVSSKMSLLAWCSLLLGSVIVIGSATDYPLFEPDEARNSQLAINIYETGDWVSLRLGPEPYWDKPPAVAWGTAISYHLFGVSSWSTRLVSNVTAVMTVLMTFYFGRRMVGFKAAWLGATLLLLSLGFVICGRYATMDAAITCCAIAMFGSIYMAITGARFRYGYWIVASIACGIGLLVKGPVIGVLTLPPLFVWMWLTNNRSLLRLTPWLVMSVVAFAIAGPWFITMGLTEPEFLTYFFWKHHVVRFSDAFNHREPFWFYGPVLVLGTFPASLLLPTLIPLFRRYGAACRTALTSKLGLVALYAAWVIGFFSLSDSKLPTYILPSFPAVALLYAVAGVAFTTDFSRQSQQEPNHYLRYFFSIPKRSAVTFTVAVVAVSAVSILLFKNNAWTTWFSGIAVVGLLMSVVAWIYSRRPVVAVATSLSLGLLFIVTMTSYVLPEVSSFRSIQKSAAALHEKPEFRDLPIVFYSHENYGCQIWLPQESIESFDEYDMVRAIEYLQQQQTCLLVSRLDAMEMLRSNLDSSLELSSIKGARHLYLCHPASGKPESTNQAAQRLAGRLESVTFSR